VSVSCPTADLRAPTPTAAAEIAVPVLADVRHTLATLAHRTERCVRRYHERAGERLAALVRVLPRRDALLGPQRQKMDDLGGRLDRALERRVTLARGQLDRSAGALRPAMLDQRLAAAKQRLAGIGRHLELVHPNRPLEKGYAWVEARGTRKVIGTAEGARAAGAVTLHFIDGAVDARVERPGGKSYDAARPEQPSLL
jgi:exodeoxyribonuclease VII large subunit